MRVELPATKLKIYPARFSSGVRWLVKGMSIVSSLSNGWQEQKEIPPKHPPNKFPFNECQHPDSTAAYQLLNEIYKQHTYIEGVVAGVLCERVDVKSRHYGKARCSFILSEKESVSLASSKHFLEWSWQRRRTEVAGQWRVWQLTRSKRAPVEYNNVIKLTWFTSYNNKMQMIFLWHVFSDEKLNMRV